MEDRESRILKEAAQVFMKYGVKSINMDDMARHLGMSKKTLYLYVKDKEELVRKAVHGYCLKEDSDIRTICKKGLNAIDENLEIMQWVLGILQNIHPSVSFDIEKYHPEVYDWMMEHRHRAIYDCMMQNMKKGQSEGLYRKDFNAEAIAKIYIARLDLIFDQKLFPQSEWKPQQVYVELFKYHIRGIASIKGTDYLKEKLKQIKY